MASRQGASPLPSVRPLCRVPEARTHARAMSTRLGDSTGRVAADDGAEDDLALGQFCFRRVGAHALPREDFTMAITTSARPSFTKPLRSLRVAPGLPCGGMVDRATQRGYALDHDGDRDPRRTGNADRRRAGRG